MARHSKIKSLSADGHAAFNSLLRMQARRDHSEFELRRKLSLRYTPAAVQCAMEQAREKNWLPDERDLALRMTEGLDRRHKGSAYIKNFLRKRGLPAPPLDEGKELEKARHLIKNKFGPTELSFTDKPKAYRYLQNRGFAPALIKRVLHEKS